MAVWKGEGKGSNVAFSVTFRRQVKYASSRIINYKQFIGFTILYGPSVIFYHPL